jgi:hypothetical protein
MLFDYTRHVAGYLFRVSFSTEILHLQRKVCHTSTAFLPSMNFTAYRYTYPDAAYKR